MNKQIRYIFLLLFMLVINITVNAQQKYATEAELKKGASELFEADEFDKAFPLYSQLTSIYPKDPDYNYRLGVCMIYAFEDKEKPIRFLEFASIHPEVDREVLYYLAKAYHLNYRFDDAILKYKEYKKVASSAKATKLQVDRQIEMCKNGKLLLRNLSDLIVTDKKVYDQMDENGIRTALREMTISEMEFDSTIEAYKNDVNQAAKAVADRAIISFNLIISFSPF